MPFPPARYATATGRTSFLLRQIITTGYVICGYRNSQPWTSVNQVTHSTDTTVDYGSPMPNSTAYPAGMADDNFAYVLKANNGVGGSSTANNRYSMRTNTGTTFAGSPVSVANGGTAMHQEQTRAWVNPHTNAGVLMRFNFASATFISNIGQSYGQQGASGGSSFYGENHGYQYGDGDSSVCGFRLNFATETQQSTNVYGAHGQQKAISSKVGKGYAGSEGNYAGGNSLRRFNLTTETNIGNVSKPITNCGEEDHDMGQAHQYMLGNYNGEQNNRSWRFNYATDSGYEGGGTMQSKGVPGRSSAYSAQRS